jgi:hypothetical protein
MLELKNENMELSKIAKRFLILTYFGGDGHFVTRQTCIFEISIKL